VVSDFFPICCGCPLPRYLKNVQNETTPCFFVGNTKISILTKQGLYFAYEVLQNDLLLETAVEAKMLTFVLPTEKRLVVSVRAFLKISRLPWRIRKKKTKPSKNFG